MGRAHCQDWMSRVGESCADLEEVTANTQSIKDTAKRHGWIEREKV